MKVVWLNLGEAPDYAKLGRVGATGVAFDIRDPRLTLAYLRTVRDRNLIPYVYTTPHWPETMHLTGSEFAVWTSALLDRIAPRTGKAMPCVCFDIEHHDHLFVRGCLARWRELRPGRITRKSWATQNRMCRPN